MVCGDACVPGFGCGLARESEGGGVCEVRVSVSCIRLPPVFLNGTRGTLFWLFHGLFVHNRVHDRVATRYRDYIETARGLYGRATDDTPRPK